MAWKSEHNSSKTELGFTGYLPGAQATHCLFPPPAVAHQPLANKFLDQANLRTSAWIRSQTAVLTLPEMHVINPVGPAGRVVRPATRQNFDHIGSPSTTSSLGFGSCWLGPDEDTKRKLSVPARGQPMRSIV